MKTIWKFPLQITDAQRIDVPGDYKPLHVALDPGGMLCVWIEVYTENPKVAVIIGIFGTGNPIPTNLKPRHLGSAVMGTFVWHVYEIDDEEDQT